ncbi:MAG TPA: glycosyltransferase family 9 protein [Ignavibacteriales bacterium]|nr:glycosyltransferase family 9 protein [Ignavibacteriales bacterium]
MSGSKQKRILISRPDRIGDVVLSTGMPREIKKTFPDSFVAVLLRPYTKDIYLNNPYVDEIIIDDISKDDIRKEFYSNVRKIRSLKFTHGLMLLPSERINWMLFLAGVKTRVGSGHKLFQMLANVRSVSRHKYIPLRHEADYCMDLARKIGVKGEDISPEIFLSESEKKEAADFRKRINPENKILIGVHTTSGNSAPNLSKNEYAKLINMLTASGKYIVAVTDNVPPDEVKDLPRVVYPNIDMPLRRTIALLPALDLLVSASTGPMHIAAALKVKTLSFFCPLTACSPLLWGPKGNKAEIMQPEEDYCSKKCPGDPKKCDFSGSSVMNSDAIYSRIAKLF